MESDLQQQQQQQHHHHAFLDHGHDPPLPQHHQQQQMSSGLSRYRSAPSSFASLFERDFCNELLGRPPSPETERFLARLISGGQDESPPPKVGGSNPNLVRHSSSPAGLFANINIDNGFASMESMRNFVACGGANAEASFANANRLTNHMSYSSRPAVGHMSPISELGDKRMEASIDEGAAFGEGNANDYVAGYPMSSWEDSASMSENFNALKRSRDDDKKFSGLNASDLVNEEVRSRPPMGLTHHLSLPKTSAEISSIEKFLQLQDSVPCKIRAKRGCATHPRSIAERVRRTKISERMRKLQDLVPNMDKQTNTADMLDLAVDYIKDLQTQVKGLSANRARCTCLNRQQQ